MRNIITIMSKEFARFFGDKRMILMTVMPAILIYVVYSFMGTMMANVFAPDEDHTPRIFAVNAPGIITEQVRITGGMEMVHVGAVEVESIKEMIINGDADLLLVFPPDFDLTGIGGESVSAGDTPNIEIYFISTEPNSHEAYMHMVALLNAYKDSLVNLFNINKGIENADLATPQDIAASIISTMMPMLLMIFLYSGCMGLALESITGEKERGTLATLLVSPLKRSELAIGKILSLAVLSFLSGAITAGATILALPNMMGAGMDEMMDVNIYGAADYALLAFVILTVLLLMVAMLSIVSAFSKTVKEAGQAATPLMIIVMLVGVSGMLGGGVQHDPIFYIIPLYGSVQSMSGIFALDYSAVNVVIACLSTLVYAGIGGFVLTKMFNSEKIMFSR